MRATFLPLFALAIALSACETPTAQRYSVSADNVVALRSQGVTGIAVGTIRDPRSYDSACRGVGSIRLADGLSHGAYIQKAIADELKLAGAWAELGASRVTLSGTLSRVAFSSSHGVTGGYWELGLEIQSSNGRQGVVSERYDFDSGFSGDAACKAVAEAYPRAVQNLVSKIVRSPNFAALIR